MEVARRRATLLDKNKSVFILSLLICSLIPNINPIHAKNSNKNFKYPTETFLIEKQDYLGTWAEWDIYPLNKDLTFWNFSWVQRDYINLDNNTISNPLLYKTEDIDEISDKLKWNNKHERTEVNKSRIIKIDKDIALYLDEKNKTQVVNYSYFEYDRTVAEKYIFYNDYFDSDKYNEQISKLNKYPVKTEYKYIVKEFPNEIDFSNKSGWFTAEFVKWRHGIKFEIGFNTTIIYSAPSNRITCSGGSANDPITFWDLWNASNVNGWDVVNNTCNTQFKFWCQLYIGDGSTETWFNDTDVQVLFNDGIATGNWFSIIYIRNNAHFTLGNLDDESDYSTSHGVSLKNKETTYTTYFVRTYTDEGYSGIYNSFIQGNGTDIRTAFQVSGDIFNTEFDGIELLFGGATTVDMKNVYILNSGYEGINRPLANSTFEDILIKNAQYGIEIGGTESSVFRNIVVDTSRTNPINLWVSTVNQYLIDCEMEDWGITYSGVSTHRIYRQYTINIMVKDNVGSPIENATVTLYDSDGSNTFNVLTDSGGWIAEQTVSRGYYMQTYGLTIQDYSPHRLHVEKDGYEDYDIYNITLTEPICWEVTLSDTQGKGSSPFMIIIIILIIAMIVLRYVR